YFPNPTTGEFNFAVALPEATTLSIIVTNTLGQTVFSKVENNISNSVLRYDLSSIGKGIYFVNITDSKNNMVTKKIIVE
ncbi:MAG TPA: T9SS type A sorting domain-containing protein, partial [Bacteroidia bacterium]